MTDYYNFDDEVDLFAVPHIPSHSMFNTDSESDMDKAQNWWLRPLLHSTNT